MLGSRRFGVVTWLALLAGTASCGPRDGRTTPDSSARTAVAERRSDDRPPLVIVERDGDPNGAVAFACVHDGGSAASAAAAALLAARLRDQGLSDVRARAQALGFTIDVAVANEREAARFVDAVSKALATPPRQGERGLDAAQAAVVGLGNRRLAGPGAANVAACSGELGIRTDQPLADAARIPAVVAELFTSVRSVERAAFGAVGRAEILKATEEALGAGGDWPDGDPVEDAWPERNVTAADFAGTEPRRLSMALRLPTPAVAVGAANALGEPRGTLARRLETLRPPWRLERAAATARPRGACLRVDALPPPGDPGPTGVEVARVLALMSEEVDREVAEAPRSAASAFEEALLRPTDPGEAAAAAAWRGLSDRLAAGAPRRLVAYTAPAADRARVDLARAMSEVREAQSKPFIETRVRVEHGQSGFWALLASTCGTAGESLADAGEAAALVTALALVQTNREGVSFEPWIATDGVGLLAHAPRRSPSETPAEQARRVANALGDLVATARPTPTARLTAHEELLEALGRSPRPGLALSLQELSQGHPSWLEPRGSIAALGAATSRSFEAALHHWLRFPLRLSVLANGDANQVDVARRELERWLLPVRGDAVRCPPLTRVEPKSAELMLTTTPGDVAESAYFAVPIARFEGRMPLEVRATVHLLNRSGGWLERTLSDLQATAFATALGGPRAAALVVRLAVPLDQRDGAIVRLRALFDRFATGLATSADIAAAERELARADAVERRDPRRRIVETWRGATTPARLDATRLMKFQADLGRAGRLVVLVNPANGG